MASPFPWGPWGPILNALTLGDLEVQQAKANVDDTKALAALRGVETQLAQQRMQENAITKQVMARDLASGAASVSPDNNSDETPIQSAQRQAKQLMEQANLWNKASMDIMAANGDYAQAHKMRQDANNNVLEAKRLMSEARLEMRDSAKQMSSIAGEAVTADNDEAFQAAMQQMRMIDPKVDKKYLWNLDNRGLPTWGDNSRRTMATLEATGIDAAKRQDIAIKASDEKRKADESRVRMEEEKARTRELDALAALHRSKTPGTAEFKRAEKTGGGGGGGAPGGVGSELVQDATTGQRYVINKRSGKAWEFDDEEGRYKEIPISNVPKNIAPILKMGSAGSRENVFTQRQVLAANEAARDLENVVKLPLSVSTGVFGGREQGPSLLAATKEVLANKMTTEEVQLYNAMATGFQRSLATIEAAGLMPSGRLTGQMESVMLREGDTNLTKLSKLAQIRQIVDAGMEVILANPRVSDSEKDQVRKIVTKLEKAVPYTQADVIKLIAAPGADETLKDIMPKKGRSAGGSIGTPERRVTADGRVLEKRPDGSIVEITQ